MNEGTNIRGSCIFLQKLQSSLRHILSQKEEGKYKTKDLQYNCAMMGCKMCERGGEMPFHPEMIPYVMLRQSDTYFGSGWKFKNVHKKWALTAAIEI